MEKKEEQEGKKEEEERKEHFIIMLCDGESVSSASARKYPPAYLTPHRAIVLSIAHLCWFPRTTPHPPAQVAGERAPYISVFVPPTATDAIQPNRMFVPDCYQLPVSGGFIEEFIESELCH